MLLEPHQYGEDDKDLPKTVTVAYDATVKYETEMAYLKELKLFEDLAELMETTYRFKPGLVIGAAECGQANAYWRSNERKLTICYELVREFKEMANK